MAKRPLPDELAAMLSGQKAGTRSGWSRKTKAFVAVGVVLLTGLLGYIGFDLYEMFTYGFVAERYPRGEIESLLGLTQDAVEAQCREKGYRTDWNPVVWNDVSQVVHIEAPRGVWLVGLVYTDGKTVNYHVLYSNPGSVFYHDRRMH